MIAAALPDRLLQQQPPLGLDHPCAGSSSAECTGNTPWVSSDNHGSWSSPNDASSNARPAEQKGGSPARSRRSRSNAPQPDPLETICSGSRLARWSVRAKLRFRNSQGSARSSRSSTSSTASCPIRTVHDRRISFHHPVRLEPFPLRVSGHRQALHLSPRQPGLDFQACAAGRGEWP